MHLHQFRKIVFRLLLAVFIGWLSAGSAQSRTAESNAPAQLVKSFYRDHFSHDMGFTATAIQRKRKWLEPGLYKLSQAKLAEPRSPDEAPTINGDPFTDSQEYPHSFRIVKTIISAHKADVQVLFQWIEQRKVVNKRTITVKLNKRGSRWQIANLVYESGPDLRTLLKPPTAVKEEEFYG